MTTRQQLEQQLVAAHRSGNVQAAQQAAYAIRQYDQNALYAQVPSVNAPPPIDRVPKPTFGDWLENVSYGWGKEYANQIQGLTDSVQRGVSAFAKDPLKASAAAFMSALEPARQGFTQPVQTAKDVGAGVVETGKQMYQQATSGPVGLGQTLGQLIDMPGPDLPGGKRRQTIAELDVYHGTPHTFEPEEGAPLGRFRSSKIGTGEGAQVYGHGLYFAEDAKTGEYYRKSLSGQGGFKLVDKDGKTVTFSDTSPNSLAEIYLNGNAGDFAKTQKQIEQLAADSPEYADEYLKAVDSLNEFKRSGIRSVEKDAGRLYKVDLPDAKIEQMLDWDEPVPESVRKKISATMMEQFGSGATGTSGERLYKEIANEFRWKGSKNPNADASEFLRQQGVPGIKYLDAGSRAGEKGTRNFVVFPGEEQHLTILERDGVKAEVPKPAAPKPTTWQGMSRDEFLGNPKITTNRNAADLKPRALTTVVTEQPKPFKGNLTIRMNEDGAAVYDGNKVIASYNFGDTLVVDKKYRKQGIGEELVYQWRKANPTAPPATERTKASQAIQEKVWQRLLNEQG